MILTKADLRQQMRQQRLKLSASRRAEAACLSYACLYPAIASKNFVLSSASFGSELDLWSLNAQLAQEARLVLPRVVGKQLMLHKVTNLNELITSSFGIQEPDPKLCPIVKLSDIDMILVPGLAFDAQQHRLGFGQGFYDRLLNGCNIPTIGVGFKEQLLPRVLPIHPWDVALSSLHLF